MNMWEFISAHPWWSFFIILILLHFIYEFTRLIIYRNIFKKQ